MTVVSVILPSYNHEAYLERRLESIFSQSFSDFELIALDDASTDNSVGILETYAIDPRVRLIVNTENSGSPFKQWNKGFALSNGEFIWIAESDDYAAPDFLQCLVNALEAHPSAGIAYCQSWLVPPDISDCSLVLAESMHEMFADHWRWEQGYFNTGRDELANYMVLKNTIPNASGVLIRRSVLQSGLRAPETMRLAGDWMFWAKILLDSDIVFVPKPLNYFRKPHAESQRDRTKQQALEVIEGLDIYLFIRDQVPLSLTKRKKALWYQVKNWGFLSRCRRLTWSTNRTIYAKILQVHDEFTSQKFRLIKLPFVICYVTEPLRKVRFIMALFKLVRRSSFELSKLHRSQS